MPAVHSNVLEMPIFSAGPLRQAFHIPTVVSRRESLARQSGAVLLLTTNIKI